MKLSPAIKYGIAGLGLVLLLCFGLLLYSVSGSKKSAAVVKSNVCEYCGGPLNKIGECPKCLIELGQTKYRAKRESKNWYNSPVIATTVISLLCVLASAYIGLTLRTRFSKHKKGEVFYHVQCKCGRKLRYRESQINKLGKCPLCHKPLHFPQPVKEPRPGLWKTFSLRKIWHAVWD